MATAHLAALSGQNFFTNFFPNKCDRRKHREAPIAEHVHTKNSAATNGNKNPDNILRNIDPGIANDCKL